jgi:hypothetical protein
MSDTLSTAGVIGDDGIVPIYDPEAPWKIWSVNEIWVGKSGLKRYVPKLQDYVIDPPTFTTWIVTAIDQVTLIATLKEIRPANMSYSFSETDVLFGVGPGTQSDTYRVYLDKSVTPYILEVDKRLKVGGSMCSYCKLFRGNPEDNVVVSRLYDASGNFLTNNVPLEVCALDSHDNTSIKTVSSCYTNIDLPDGEVLVAVMYSDDGHVVSKRQLLVENTSVISARDASMKYITNISLKSPFLSQTLDHVIEFPLNLPISALNLMGVVNYSDGTHIVLPVDGTKFRMDGLSQFVSTIVGQKIEMVLNYALSKTECAVGAVVGEGKYMTEAYSLTVTDVNSSLAVKLYGYPVWVNQAVGYTMRWWMFNLDRNLFFDVTNNVSFAENTGPFDPKGYGYLQRKSINLNLSEVSGTFRPMVHTQVVDIVLNGIPNNDATPWLVSSEAQTNGAMYGDQVKAVKQYPDESVIDISCKCTTLNDWLDKIYWKTFPLKDTLKELTAPTPTHFEVRYGTITKTYTIAQWNELLDLGVDLTTYSTIFVRFFKRTATIEMELSMAAMIVTTLS